MQKGSEVITEKQTTDLQNSINGKGRTEKNWKYSLPDKTDTN